jgi:hypothetical protein
LAWIIVQQRTYASDGGMLWDSWLHATHMLVCVCACCCTKTCTSDH